MNERSRELLSAYLDDALDDAELGELARHLEADDSLVDLAARYQLVGDCLRGARSPVEQGASSGLLTRVRQDIAAGKEPAVTVSPVAELAPRRRSAQWLHRPMTGLALAAGIALVAIGGLRVWNAAQEPEAAPAVADSAPPGLSSAEIQWTVAAPEVKRRLDQYLFDHSEVRPGSEPVVRQVSLVQVAAIPRASSVDPLFERSNSHADPRPVATTGRHHVCAGDGAGLGGCSC